MQQATTKVDTRERMRAIHCAAVRISRVETARKNGDAIRTLSRASGSVTRRSNPVSAEIAAAIEALAERGDAIRKAVRKAQRECGDDLTAWPLWPVTAHATRRGWQTLYQRKLVRVNPARTSWDREALLASAREANRT